MTGSPRASILVCTLLVALAAAVPVVQASEPPTRIRGTVVRVADGDSITVLTGRKKVEVRLGEIDAPEKDQHWADPARVALRKKVQGKLVTVEVTDIDRHGRAVGTVRLDSRNINRQLVREGHAWVYRRYLIDESLLTDEAGAIEAGIGLWGNPAPVAPWDWRRGARQPAGSSRARRCGAKTYCREMNSCAEARFYLNSCGLSHLDGDEDGMPCESLCRQ